MHPFLIHNGALFHNIFYSIIFLCYGSFLNIVAHRGIEGISLLERPSCPACGRTKTWYDLISLGSWIFGRGACRWCTVAIPWIYPFVEVITSLFFTALVSLYPWYYAVIYVLFCSALLVTLHTDIQYFLILRSMTLWLIPCAFLASYYHFLPITLYESVIGALGGFGILWIVRALFWHIRGLEGMGEGDLELLAMIGSFLGPYGCWVTLTIGSFLGTLIGAFLILFYKKNGLFHVPFGAFLSFSALLYVLLSQIIF